MCCQENQKKIKCCQQKILMFVFRTRVERRTPPYQAKGRHQDIVSGQPTPHKDARVARGAFVVGGGGMQRSCLSNFSRHHTTSGFYFLGDFGRQVEIQEALAFKPCQHLYVLEISM
jgi:hypothetical protein